MILDIFEYCKNNDKDGILLFLDYEKAFDSVEYNFMFKVLKKFNFGDSFIGMIKTLYNDPIFKVKTMVGYQNHAQWKEVLDRDVPFQLFFLYLYLKY